MFSLFTWFVFTYQYEILIENMKKPTKQSKIMAMVQNGCYVQPYNSLRADMPRILTCHIKLLFGSLLLTEQNTVAGTNVLKYVVRQNSQECNAHPPFVPVSFLLNCLLAVVQMCVRTNNAPVRRHQKYGVSKEVDSSLGKTEINLILQFQFFSLIEVALLFITSFVVFAENKVTAARNIKSSCVDLLRQVNQCQT